MAETELSLKLAQDDIERMLKQTIQAQVTAAMAANGDALIATFVERILAEKVDSEGRPGSYSSNVPYIEWMSRKTIQAACKEAIAEWLEEHKPAVKAAVKKALTRDKDKLATEAAQTLLSSGAYGLSVSVGLTKRERNY